MYRFENFKRRALPAPTGGEAAKSDSKRLCGLMSGTCQVSAQSRKLWAANRLEDPKNPNAPPRKKSQTPAPQDCADWCLVPFYQFQLNWMNTVSCVSIFRVSRGTPPQRPLERKRRIQLRAIERTDAYYHPIERTDVWHHSTKFQLNRMKILGCELIWRFQETLPHSDLWEKIAKSGTERLCSPTSSINLQVA